MDSLKTKVYYPILVGVVLQALRAETRTNQDYIAGVLGISTSAYSRVETGKSALDVARLEKIGRSLNTSASKILDEVKDFEDKVLKPMGTEVVFENAKSSKGVLMCTHDIVTRIYSNHLLSK